MSKRPAPPAKAPAQLPPDTLLGSRHAAPAPAAPPPPEPISLSLTITRVVNGYILNTSIGRDGGFAEQRKSVARDEFELGTLVRRWAQSGTPAKKPARPAPLAA